jgi:hypothetical protein
MRIVVPYTRLSHGCEESLRRYAPEAERVYVGGDVVDYWRLMCRVWADQEDFIVIEHDTVFDAPAIEILLRCPEDFCTAGQWFQMARFRRAMMNAAPGLFESTPLSERHWIALEWYARPRLARVGGYHSHTVEASTFNEARGLIGTEAVGAFSSRERAPIWSAWLRTLPSEVRDRHTDWAWAQIHCNPDGTDDGRACRLPACKRAGRGAIPTVCSRCRDEPFDRPLPRLLQIYGGMDG